MKVCTKCKVEKDFDEFYKNARLKDGLKSQCKDCDRKYHEKNKERIAKRKKEYNQKNREKVMEYGRKYRENNKEKIMIYQKKYIQNNRDKSLKWQRTYREKNRDKIYERTKIYRENNKDKVIEWKRKYYENNKDKVIESHKKYRENSPYQIQSTSLSSSARKRAKEKNIPIDLDFISMPNIVDWLKSQPRCECCNVEFSIGIKNGKGQLPNSPSLDKFYPEKGYVKGNVHLICMRCNALKTNADSKRLRTVVDWMEKIEIENELIKPVIDNNG